MHGPHPWHETLHAEYDDSRQIIKITFKRHVEWTEKAVERILRGDSLVKLESEGLQGEIWALEESDYDLTYTAAMMRIPERNPMDVS